MSAPDQPNPYAPPASQPDSTAAPATPVAEQLATRWQRLGGALLDGLLDLLAAVPLFFGLPLREYARAVKENPNPILAFTMAGTWGLVAAVLLFALAVFQWTLLATRGQTLGKIVAGTRVVRVDGSPAGFLHAVVIRNWPFSVIYRVPVIKWLVLIDWLCIFGERRRCLHDAIAGTNVVRAQVPL
jgi:uncharacterized RDD family membrane protein YckC